MSFRAIFRYKMLLSICLCVLGANGQNIINDTVFVNTNSQVTFKFSGRAEGTFDDSNDRSYQVSKGANDKSFLVRATQPDAKPKLLRVSDGNRRHEFTLIYRDEISELVVDWSNSRKLKDHVNEKKKKVTAQLAAARDLMDRTQYEKAAEILKRLVYDVEESQRESVLAMQTRCEDELGAVRAAKFKEAVETADAYSAERKFELASLEFGKAYSIIPDSSVLAKWKKVNKAWCKAAGDSANLLASQANYATSLMYYQKAQKADSVDFAKFYRSGYQSTEGKYNDFMHKKFEAKGNAVFELEEWEEAKSAYDSALLYKTDKICRDRLARTNEKLMMRKDNLLKEQDYYRYLSTAKILAARATTQQDLEEAITHYKKAEAIFKGRRYPKEKITALEKLQKGLAAKIRAN